MAQTVAEILVDQMVEVGIRKVYGIVGDSANPIVDALRRHESDIEFVHVRNEEAGAFAAGADAQISGRPTAVLGSSGPGSVHLLNGLYDCQRNAAPVFAIATHIPSTEVGSGYFQETNPEQIFSGCTNYCATIMTRRPDATDLRTRLAGSDPGARRRHGDPARRRRRAGGQRGDAAASHPHRPPCLAPDRGCLAASRRARLEGQEDRDPRRRGHPQRPSRSARAVEEAAGAGLVRLSRQGHPRARQPGRGRDDRPAGLGRRHEGPGRLRPAVHARHRLPVPRVPAGG